MVDSCVSHMEPSHSIKCRKFLDEFHHYYNLMGDFSFKLCTLCLKIMEKGSDWERLNSCPYNNVCSNGVQSLRFCTKMLLMPHFHCGILCQ